MKQFVTGMIVAFGIIAVYACTTPSASGGGSVKNPVLFKVNGHGVTAEEFFSSQPASQAVNEFVMLASMKEEARKAGAQVDKKKVTEDIEDLKKNITGQGQTWEEFLKSQGMTEKAFIDQRETFSLFQALLKKKANVTEAELKKVWDDDKQSLINKYASDNHLPDSEKAKITFEQVKDIAREQVEMQKMSIVQGEVMNDIILNSKLEFVSLDAVKAKEISERIMGPALDRAKKQKEEQEKAKAAEKDGPKGGEAMDLPATGAKTPKTPGSTNDGKSVARPVEGSGKGGK